MSNDVVVTRCHNDQIVVISINRSERRNAVNLPTARALTAAFLDFDADKSAKVAILEGLGGNFCAGADLQELAKGTDQTNELVPMTAENGEHRGPMGPTRLLLQKPVIAAITGFCVAGGLELALWADLRVVEESATLGVFCRRWGVPLIDGGTVRLPRLIGASRAMDLILTGRAVSGKEALDIGLANRLAAPGAARATALALAEQLCSLPQLCMQVDRLSSIEQWGLPLKGALENEFSHSVSTMQTVMAEAAQGAKRFAHGAGRHGQAAPVSSLPPPGAIKAVIFDLGGVVFDSPIQVIMNLEKRLGIPNHGLNRLMAKSSSFQALEQGRLPLAEFIPAFSRECVAAGFRDVGVEALFQEMSSGAPRQRMYTAIQQLRAAGYKTGCITNNWSFGDSAAATKRLEQLFDYVVESSIVKLRKPDPAIFEYTCKKMGIRPEQAVFLDDIGVNLKAAQSLGMTTIKVQRTDASGEKAIEALFDILERTNKSALSSKL